MTDFEQWVKEEMEKLNLSIFKLKKAHKFIADNYPDETKEVLGNESKKVLKEVSVLLGEL